MGCGPLGPFAGGALSGPVQSGPIDDWSIATSTKTAQLETRPDDPHSVNTWFAWIEEDLYVPTSMILGPKNPSDRGWVVHVSEDPRVRIRLAGRVYERRAVRVLDVLEYEAARRTLEKRYALAREDRDPEREIWIYRLDPR